MRKILFQRFLGLACLLALFYPQAGSAQSNTDSLECELVFVMPFSQDSEDGFTTQKLGCAIPLSPADSNSTVKVEIKASQEGTVLETISYKLVKTPTLYYAESSSNKGIVNNGKLMLLFDASQGTAFYQDKWLVVTLTGAAGQSIRSVQIKI